MRSSFAKQAVMRRERQIAHQPGDKMIADIGTKSLSYHSEGSYGHEESSYRG